MKQGLTRDFAIASVKIGTEIRLSKGRRSFPTSHDFTGNSFKDLNTFKIFWNTNIQLLSNKI